MPWPSNPDGTPLLEDKKFCPTGKTWSSIMRSTGTDAIYSLSREVITTYLNVLRGTPISSADWEKWQSGTWWWCMIWRLAYAELTDCCFDPKFCRTANFDSWTQFFHAYNTGVKGVQKCGDQSRKWCESGPRWDADENALIKYIISYWITCIMYHWQSLSSIMQLCPPAKPNHLDANVLMSIVWPAVQQRHICVVGHTLIDRIRLSHQVGWSACTRLCAVQWLSDSVLPGNGPAWSS